MMWQTSSMPKKQGARTSWQKQPTFRETRLAAELRRARANADMKAEEVAAALGWDPTRVSKIERARMNITPEDVEAMTNLYGTRADRRAALIELAREARRRGWWAAYGDIFRGSYVDMEDSATEILTWEAQIVPGILQTSGYARMIFAALWPQGDPAEVEQRIRARMGRKPLLERPDAPRLEAIIDEGVFLRAFASDGPATVEQVRYLLDRPDNVVVRIVPVSIGLHAGLDGSFTILRFEDLADRAYVESRGGDLYVEDVEGVRAFHEVYDLLGQQALSPADTRIRLEALIEEHP